MLVLTVMLSVWLSAPSLLSLNTVYSSVIGTWIGCDTIQCKYTLYRTTSARRCSAVCVGGHYQLQWKNACWKLPHDVASKKGIQVGTVQEILGLLVIPGEEGRVPWDNINEVVLEGNAVFCRFHTTLQFGQSHAPHSGQSCTIFFGETKPPLQNVRLHTTPAPSPQIPGEEGEGGK